jgi:hypothetical protein
MSKHEAPARFHDRCAARHRIVKTRRWRSRCIDAGSTITLTIVRIRLLCRSRIYTSARAVDLRIVKEI